MKTRRERLQAAAAGTQNANVVQLRAAEGGPLGSATATLMRRAQALGLFGGRRQLNVALGYPDTISVDDYWKKYERGGIAKRCVEAFPNSTWRGGGELVEDEDPDVETDFEKAFDELNKRLKIWPTFERADIMAGLGEYAIILIGAPGDFAAPLQKLRPEEITYLTPFSQREAKMGDVEQDVKSARFNMPLYYNISVLSNNNAGAVSTKSFDGRVHWTRVIHVCDGALNNPLVGTPRLRAIYNYLEDLDKVVGGGAEASWKRADRGLHVKLDPTASPDKAQLDALKESIEEYTHDLKRVVTTRGVEIESLSSDVANFNPNASTIVELISATLGIPQRILMGSERGELASSNDQSNYDDRVQDRRESFADPNIVRPFVEHLQNLGALPKAEYEVRWPEVDDLNEDQKMKLALDAAKVNQAMGETVLEPNEIRDKILGWESLDHLAVDPELIQQQREKKLQPPTINPEDANEPTDVTVMTAKHMRLLKLKKRRKRNW